MEALIFFLVTGSISGFIGWLIAKGKGRGKAGLLQPAWSHHAK